MTSTFRICRIGGVDVDASWTWLAVFALLTWWLAGAVFPDTNPGLAAGTYAAMGVVAAVLVFASIVLHELGHARRARREGMQVEGVTLWADRKSTRLNSSHK
jgi:Zn-dependent protease